MNAFRGKIENVERDNPDGRGLVASVTCGQICVIFEWFDGCLFWVGKKVMVIEKKLFSIRSPFFLSSVVNAFRCFFDELWFFYCYCVCKIALAYETPKQRDNTSAKSNQQSPNALGQRSILVWIFVLKLLRTPLPANVKIPSKGRRNKRGARGRAANVCTLPALSCLVERRSRKTKGKEV